MKRNMRFLLLFAILTSSILAAYFISGCGDDTTTITDNPPEVVRDTVIGTVHGTVEDAYDDGRLSGVKVSWSSAGFKDSTTTDDEGYYTTGPTLTSGDYVFTFTLSNYSIASFNVNIPDVDSLRGNNPNPTGQYPYEEDLEANIWPKTGALSGNIFTALPTGVSAKDMENGMALDDPNYATAAAGVIVTLDFSAFNVKSNKYYDTTDANGAYSFSNIPVCQNVDVTGTDNDQWVVLRSSAFTDGGKTYAATEYSGANGNPIALAPAAAGGTALPNIYAPLSGQDQRDLHDNAYVIDYNWEGTTVEVDDTLVVTFSHAMDSSKTTITFAPTHTFSWSADYMTLYIVPVSVLSTDTDYNLSIDSWSQDGRRLYDTDGTTVFTRTVSTQVGLDLVSTNLGSAGTYQSGTTYINFGLDSSIILNFNMDVNGAHGGNTITFTVGGTEVDFDTTFSGSQVIIDPDYSLVTNQTYSLSFKFYSNIQGDSYTSSTYTISTYNTAALPAQPVNVATDTSQMTWPVDYNTTSIYVEWDVQADADSFIVYANADYTALGRVAVARVLAQQYGQRQGVTVNLTATVGGTDLSQLFDVYQDAVQTPFAGGETVYFWVRAKNTKGFSPYSDSLGFKDEQGPADFILKQNVSADNTNGTTEDTIKIFLGDASNQLEYVANTAPTVTFTEGGGDPSYVPSNYTWNGWHNSLRYADTMAMDVYIDAGKVGAGDWLYVTISDNSGNAGTDSIRLTPYVEFYAPSDTSSAIFKAPSYDVAWTWHEPADADTTDIDDLDLYISYDGTTWHDTLLDGTSLAGWANDADGGSKTLTGLTDTVRSTTALLGLMDADSGWIWPTPTFTYAGLKMTISTADSTALRHADSSWYDREVTDSSAIPISFSSVGLDSVVIAYSDDAWGTTKTELDTIVVADPTTITTTTVSTYYPYNNSEDYNCYLAVKDLDADQPVNALTWSFPVTNDIFDIQTPAAGAALPANGNYNITWYNLSGGGTYTTDTLPSLVTLEYAIVDDTAGGAGAPTDTTWVTIASDVVNKGWYAWTGVPNNMPSDSVILRGITSAGTGLDTTAQFKFQGIRFKQPTSTDTLTTFDAYNVEFYQYGGFSTAYDIEYSTDGTTWTSIEDAVANGGADPETYAWTPDVANASVQLRVTSTGNDSTQATSDAFVVRGFDITKPAVPDTFYIGRPDTIRWTTVGTFTNVEILIGSVADAWTEVVTANSNNNNVFYWNEVPAGHAAATDVYIEVKDFGGTALDSVKTLVYMQPEIEVTYPDGDVIQMSFPDSIAFDVYGSRTGAVDIYLSIDGGTTYTDTITSVQPVSHGPATHYNHTWTPELIAGGPHENCVIKVVETWTGQGTAMSDESNVFTLQATQNVAPVLDAIGAKTVANGALLEFTVTASDPDGTTPTLSADIPAAPVASGATFTDNGDGTGTFSWTPAVGDVGDHDVTFTASDGSLSDDEVVTITVN